MLHLVTPAQGSSPVVAAAASMAQPEDGTARAGLEATRLAVAERYGILDTAPEPGLRPDHGADGGALPGAGGDHRLHRQRPRLLQVASRHRGDRGPSRHGSLALRARTVDPRQLQARLPCRRAAGQSRRLRDRHALGDRPPAPADRGAAHAPAARPVRHRHRRAGDAPRRATGAGSGGHHEERSRSPRHEQPAIRLQPAAAAEPQRRFDGDPRAAPGGGSSREGGRPDAPGVLRRRDA